MVTIKVYECLNKPATKKPQFCLHSPWDWWGGGNWSKKWEQKMFYTKRYQILCKKRISILTAFKKPSLASKCVFYRTEHKANGRPRKWNFQVLRMQR